MANRFVVPSDSESDNELPPSTPDRRGGSSRNRSSNIFRASADDTHMSFTPAGAPPPSSAGSFTPAGAPSASYMGSSIMRSVVPPKNVQSINFGVGSQGGGLARAALEPLPAQGRNENAPLGRSIPGKDERKGPSRLREQYQEDESQSEDAQGEYDEEAEAPPRRAASKRAMVDHSTDEEEDENSPPKKSARPQLTVEDSTDEEEQRPYEAHAPEIDMWLDMDADEQADDENEFAEMALLNTPGAIQKVRREAEDIYRASAARGGPRQHPFKCSTIAREYYSQAGYATLTETPRLVIETEVLLSRLYADGVGSSDDAERLDDALAEAAGQLTGLWKDQVDGLPRLEEEHVVEMGPPPSASAFEKATFLATLALQVHHTRTSEDGRPKQEPLPGALFQWKEEYHNIYNDQIEEVVRHKPSPAGHSLYWQSVFVSLLSGKVEAAQTLLTNAGWDRVNQPARRGEPSEPRYTGRILANVQKAMDDVCNLLESCPGGRGDWDVWNSDWTLFRIRARGAMDHLRRFAEGKLPSMQDMDASALDSSPAPREPSDRRSMTVTARRAASQIPWEIYENLEIVFEIVLGSPDVIIQTAQDWCEATIALLGWWNEATDSRTGNGRLAPARSLMIAPQGVNAEAYMDRLTRAFQLSVQTDHEVNSLNPVEVGMACVFEDNVRAVIAILRTWSLPIAASVAEIASLGHWLPQHQPSALFAFDDLDREDLNILGIDPEDPDEIDGVKDNTLIQYAQELVDYHQASSVKDRFGVVRDGWEVAISVLGRMDSPQRAEATVGELTEKILGNIGPDSSDMVDRVWRLLNELGMIVYAEQTANHFGNILKTSSHRYGEAIWYYALAHRRPQIHEVISLLVSQSLCQSTAYPPTNDLDPHLRRLLEERTATLEDLAHQDLEAAELLGTMLSGYATLRRFYSLRDASSSTASATATGLPSHTSAADALIAVITSADDPIRGGLFDATREAIISPDFLLVLLGEALPFLSSSSSSTSTSSTSSTTPKPSLTQAHINTLLKSIQDLTSLPSTSRISTANTQFFQLVLASAPAILKGASPKDLLASTDGSPQKSGMLSTTTMLASQLHRSIRGDRDGGSAQAAGRNGVAKVYRAWDWRAGLTPSSTAEDVVRMLRLGLSRELARIWLGQVDGDGDEMEDGY